MALKDKFTIQMMDLDTKNISYDTKGKEFEAYCHKECEKHTSIKYSKIFCD